MADRRFPATVSLLRRVFPRADTSEADGLLLDRFLTSRDEAAFAILLERHGPMVLRLCYRFARNAEDAEDAFQAVFLILLRKGGGLRNKDHLGAWLYGVAYRVALKARVQRARRHEREGTRVDDHSIGKLDPLTTPDLTPVIDQEIQRLPEKYRLPLVLCGVEGKSGVEAAQLLGWPQGTVSGRLSRARSLLRTRLARRGITLTAPLLAAALGGPGVAAGLPCALLDATRLCSLNWLTHARPGFAVAVLSLAQAASRDMIGRKLVVGLLIACLACGTGLATVAWALSGRAEHENSSPPAAQKKPGDLPPPVKKDIPSGPWREAARVNLGPNEISARAMAPGGRLVATPQALDVKLADMAAPKNVRILPGRSGGAAALAFSPDAALLAAAGQDAGIKVWDLAAQKPRFLLHRHMPLGNQFSVSALALSRDYLASGDIRGNLMLWDLRTGKFQESLQPHASVILDLAFTPDGKTLLSSDLNDTLRVWDVSKRKVKYEVRLHYPMLYAVSHDGALAAVPDLPRETVRLLRLDDGKEIGRLTTDSIANMEGRLMQALAFRPDGKVLATGSHDGTLRLWDLERKAILSTWPGHDAALLGIAFSADGLSLSSIDQKGTAKKWEIDKRIDK